MKHIQSKDNPQLKMLAKLAASVRARKDSGLTLLDGDHLVEAYIESGGKANVIAISETALTRPRQKALFERCPAHARLILADRLLGAVSPVETASGMIAAIPVPAPGPWPELAETCLLLEDIQDPGNLGSMLRIAAAAGLRHVALSKGCASAWAPKTIRAGMGAHFLLNLHENADLVALVEAFSGKVAATEPKAGTTLYATDLRTPVAWLFGNEGAGLSPALSPVCQRPPCNPDAGQDGVPQCCCRSSGMPV
jgi:TrmH family RNA methyltransferase